MRKDLEREIQIVNLVNVLYLTDEQISKLLTVIREADALDDRHESAVALQHREMIAVYRDLKEELLKNTDASYKMKMRYYKEHDREKQLEESYAAERKALVGKVREILGANQRIMTQEYSPCLIPLRSMANPERIGQVGDTTEVERMLREMRNLNVDLQKFLSMKKKFLTGAREKLEEKYSAKEIDEEIARMDKVLEKARVLKDADFELQKDGLIAQLHPKEPVKHASLLDRHIASFLLDARAIPVLLHLASTKAAR
jgi:hypothetical protein